MNINVCKKILNSVLFFIAFMIVAFVINTFLFKFRFSKTAPSIYNNIFVAIICCGLWLFVLKGKELKKSDIYFLSILIILAIAVYFFVLN